MTTELIIPRAERALIIKLRGIGDVVLSTPVIDNLAAAYPGIRIDYLCERFAAPAVEGLPNIRSVIAFDRKRESGMELVRKVRAARYDLVIDLFGNPRTALVTRLSGARHRAGFPFRGRAYAYNHLVTPRGSEVHNVEFNLDVIRALGIPFASVRPSFPLVDGAVAAAAEWLTAQGLDGRELIGVNPSGGWSAKRWRLEHFAELTRLLRDRRGASVLLFWGPGGLEDVTTVNERSGSGAHILPRTTVKEMGAFIARCSYFISNDAGPMHMAAALGVPSLGIYGPTNPRLQGPFGPGNAWVRNEEVDCLECNLLDCPIGHPCMTDLTPERVFSAFERMTHQ